MFSPSWGHYFPHGLGAVLVIVPFKARGTRSVRQTRGAQKGGLSHPTGTEVGPHPSKRGGAEANAGVVKPDDVEGEGEAASRERERRQRDAVINEQGQWWLLA